MIPQPTIGDLIRWSRTDFHQHYLAGYAIVTGDFDLMIQIHWVGISPIPLETQDDGTCWVFKSRCIIISRAGDPDYENLRYGRRKVDNGEEDGEGEEGEIT